LMLGSLDLMESVEVEEVEEGMFHLRPPLVVD
jgi:hypothetical protein